MSQRPASKNLRDQDTFRIPDVRRALHQRPLCGFGPARIQVSPTNCLPTDSVEMFFGVIRQAAVISLHEATFDLSHSSNSVQDYNRL
ncbi:MAG: hypothetical protein ABJQ21_06565 [Roseibium sp.]